MKPGKRILIVGTSCSGKTTLGKQLNQQLGFPVLDLDDIGWLPNWVERPGDDFRSDLQRFVEAGDNWIISGNYTIRSKGVAWQPATHVVWLNYPLRLLVYRYFKRTFNRVLTKEQVCGDNRETLYNTIFAEDSLLLWILKTYRPNKVKFQNWRAGNYKDKTWIEINRTNQLDSLSDLLSA